MKSANLALSDIQLIVNHTTVATIYEMKSIACKFHMKSFEGKKLQWKLSVTQFHLNVTKTAQLLVFHEVKSCNPLFC